MNAALLLTALFNGAWQGALLCAGAVVAFRLFRRLNATTMFTVWSVLLVITVLLPVANYAFAPKPYTVRVKLTPVAVTAPLREAVRTSAPHVTGYSSNPAAPVVYHITAPAPTLRARVAAAADVVYSHASAVLLALLIVILLRLAVLARDIVRMLAARARVRLIEPPLTLDSSIQRPFKFAASTDFTSPCVLGFSPALIVIPEELLADPQTRLHSIVLHEREHVRRFDDIQNVAQRFIGAIAFFCPGVRIALRELALYREQICDDAAINGTGDRVSYAMTLTRMSQWAQGRGAPVPSLIFKRKHLLHRLEMLLDSAVSHSLRMNRRFAFSAACALALAALLVVRVQVPVIAESIVAPAPPPAPVAPRAHIEPKHAAAVHVSPIAPAIAKVLKPVKPAKPAKAPKPIRPVRLNPMLAAVHAVKAIPPRAQSLPQLVAVAPRITPVAVVPREGPEANAIAQAAAAPVPPPIHAHEHEHSTDDLLDTLSAAGLRNLSVDQLIAIRDHGVSTPLIRAAVAYFGTNMSVNDLVGMADRGVSAPYLEGLRREGVSGVSPSSVEMLLDHGASASLIRAAMEYFSPRPSAQAITALADHGVTADCIRSFAQAGLKSATTDEVIRLFDHGVNGSYIRKVRTMNPGASVDDIIRLHDAGV